MADRPLTESELKELRNNLSRLSESALQNAYREAHQECQLLGDEMPRPIAIQQFVQTWKVLWRWRKR